jgi:hypothetical protein
VILGQYLGQSIDVGPAMTAKILKENGQYVHQTTLRALTADELASPEEIKEREQFDTSITTKLGPSSTINDFKDNNNIETLMYDLYADDDDGENQHAVEREEVTEESIDQYDDADVSLPRGDTTISGRSRDGNKNLMAL